MQSTVHPLTRMARLVGEEKNDVFSIYGFALLNGLIQLSLPLGIQAILGFVMGGALSVSLVLLIAMVVAGVLANGLLQINLMKVIEKVQQRIFVRYGFAFARHIPRLQPEAVDSFYLPELVNRFFEIPTLQKSLSKLLLEVPAATIQILIGLVLLSFYHPAFIAFGLLLLAVLGLIFYLTGNRGLRTSLAESTRKYGVAAWLEELARAFHTFRFVAGTGLPVRESDRRITHYLEARKGHFSILLLQFRTLVAFKVIISAALLIIGCNLLLQEQINIGQFVAAEIIILLVISSVEKLIINLDSVYDVMTSVEKINKLTDKPTEESGGLMLSTELLSVSFSGVSYTYPGGRLVLRNLSFDIGGGEKAALTGPDGGGKSTVLKLLCGGYEGYSGNILLNGLPLRNYNLDWLRAQTGILLGTQDIFPGTLWENLTAGGEVTDRAWVLELCSAAGLMPFIANLTKGLDEELTSGGGQLSRKVVYRILVVRALAHRPRLLLLDEFWQALDGDTRNSLQQLLFERLPHTTALIVTSDPAFAARCQHQIHIPKHAFQNTAS